MDLKIWSPFTDLEREWRLDLPGFFRGEHAGEFRPSVDIAESEGNLIITVEIPGVASEDVDVALDGRVLTIKGKKEEETEVRDESRYIHERTFGKFERHIPLPEGVSADEIAADYDKGVLTVKVTMPEKSASEPQSIEVSRT